MSDLYKQLIDITQNFDNLLEVEVHCDIYYKGKFIVKTSIIAYSNDDSRSKDILLTYDYKEDEVNRILSDLFNAIKQFAGIQERQVIYNENIQKTSLVNNTELSWLTISCRYEVEFQDAIQ